MKEISLVHNRLGETDDSEMILLKSGPTERAYYVLIRGESEQHGGLTLQLPHSTH